MTSQPNDPGAEHAEDGTSEDVEGAGVEVGRTDGEGSTFEPEEDPGPE